MNLMPRLVLTKPDNDKSQLHKRSGVAQAAPYVRGPMLNHACCSGAKCRKRYCRRRTCMGGGTCQTRHWCTAECLDTCASLLRVAALGWLHPVGVLTAPLHGA